MYTRIDLDTLLKLIQIYKEMNTLLDNLQYSDLAKCIQLYNERKIIVDNLVTHRVPLDIYNFVRQVGLLGRLKIERWKLRHKLDIFVNLDNEFSTIFRLWYNIAHTNTI
jgi:hypothetical protein